jgi:TP901 family phage tail tape measure protein
VRVVGVDLIARIGGFVAPIRAAGLATRDLKRELDVAAQAGNMDRLAMTVGITGLAMVGAFAGVIAAAATFEKQMDEVGAVSNANAAEMDKLTKAALEAGAATVFSANQAAQAEAELAKAGVEVADIYGGALTGALDLASAGSLDLESAAVIAANAMNTFGLAGKDVSHIADVLASAANTSAATVEDLGMGLRQVGLVADQAGLSLEDTVGTLAAMADAGLRGQDGATSLKTAIMRLIAPMEEASVEMERLGISAYDAAGGQKSIVDIAGQLQTKLSGLTNEQRAATMQLIFGSDAIRAGNVLYKEGAAGIQKYIDGVNDQGAAADLAAAKLDNLAGDVEQLKGSLETLFITAGSGGQGGLRIIAQQATGLVNSFAALPGPMQTAIVAMTGFGGVGLLAFAAYIKLQGALGRVAESLSAMGPMGSKAGAALSSTAKWAGRATVALIALQVAGQALNAIFGDELNPQLDALAKGIEEFARTGKLGGEAARVIGGDVEDLDRMLNGVANSGFAHATDATSDFIIGLVGMDSPMDKAKEKAAALDAALAQMVASGNADAAAAAFQRMWEAAQKEGIELDRLQAAFPEYIAAAQAKAEADLVQAETTGVATEKAKLLAGAFGEAAAAAGGLMGKFDEMNGKMLNWREAEREAEAAIDAFKEAIDRSNGSMLASTPAGRAAAEAADRVAVSAAKAAEQKYIESGSAEAAAATYATYVRQLRRALEQANVAKPVIDALIASIAAMPPSVTTNVQVNVNTHQLDMALGKLRDIRNMSAANRAGTNRWGGITEHADTGLLRQAQMFSTASPARYAFAEPATGGEAFIPRFGDRDRSMAILAQAAAWYGAQVVPRQQGWSPRGGGPTGGGGGGGGSGGGVRVENLNVRAYSDRFSLAQIERELAMRGAA